MSDEVEYVYGYGSTKHIRDADPDGAAYGIRRGEWGLCGAPGGHPLVRNHLPVCKRCEKKAAILARREAEAS